MFKRSIKNLINKLGYKLDKVSVDPITLYDHYAEFYQNYEIIKANTMVAKLGLLSLYQQLLFCEKEGVPGDFVECGVWKGGSVGLMALANIQHGSVRRHIHLFDSFEGVCEPDENVDGERAIRETRSWSRGGVKGDLKPLEGFYDQFGGVGTLEDSKKLLEETIGYGKDCLHYHKGWFQDTIPVDHKDIDKIAILRIDADWYASTKICLDYLFKKVVPGGFVIIDDYGAYEGCKKAVDEFLGNQKTKYFLNHANQEIRYIVVA